MLDGISGAMARIAAIEARINVLSQPPRPASAPTATGGAFVDVLGREIAALAPASSASSRLNLDGVPAELAAYGNGRIPASALQTIGRGSHRLWAPAAQAFEAMAAAAARDGVRIGVTDSYRSFDAQVDVARRKGLYSQGGLAATPGTSDHGWGRALDLDLDDRAQAWMRANAGRFGFVEDTPREPWHWVYERAS